MSRDYPDLIDPWQQAKARREYVGTVPLSWCKRLADWLVDDSGEVSFHLAFGIDTLQLHYVDIKVTADLPLLCQRTLEPYLQPISRHQRLGLIAREEDEAALPEHYEPFLVPEVPVKTMDLVEDELILAVPLVPVNPAAEPVEAEDEALPSPTIEKQDTPFAVLSQLKKR